MPRRSIFISYAREDGPRVHRDVALLRAGGVRVFIDVHDIEAGTPWEPALESALEKSERVLVFWSRAAQASAWVDREWRTALRKGKRVVPALLDGTAMPPELAALQGIQRSSDGPAAAGRALRLPASAWLGSAVVVVAAGWFTLHRADAPVQPGAPAIAQAPAAEPGASSTAAALAAIDKVRGQAWVVRQRAEQAIDDEASAASLREARQQLEASVHAVPFADVALPDIRRLNAEADALRAVLRARSMQFPDTSATGRELRSTLAFLGTSATVVTNPPVPQQDDDSALLWRIGLLAGLLPVSWLAVRLWLRRHRARQLVDAIFAR